MPDAAHVRGPRAGRVETLAFRIAMGLGVLWVLDDAFWHREPGTSAADHLVPGLVPVALAVVLAVLVPRWRPGLRGAVMLVAGALLVVAGVADGARHVAIDRLAGDDPTAMLAGLAGAALLVLGVVVLWRGRGRDERPVRRAARLAATGVLALLAVLFVVLPVALAIVVTHKARAPVAAVDLGAPARPVALRTSDGLRLAGSYVPSRNGAAVLVFPGRSAATAAHARMLVRHGYGALVLDRRGEGASEGTFNARGWGGEPDVRAAVAWLRSRPDVRGGRVGGLGLSVGGELLLQAAARDRGLRAVVAEGAGLRSVAEQTHMPGAPPVPLRWIAPITTETAAGVVLAGTLPPPDLAGLMPRIAPRPVLLIRGLAGNDDEALNRVYRDRGGRSVRLWEIPGAAHTGGLAERPAAYERRVVGFFDRALGPPGARG